MAATCMPSETTPSRRVCPASDRGRSWSWRTPWRAFSVPSPGFFSAGKVGAVDLQLAGFFLLPSVAAAVIGGTSIFGGIGTYTGTILGALILGVLQSLLTFLGAGQAIQQILYGAIVVGLSWLYTRITSVQ